MKKNHFSLIALLTLSASLGYSQNPAGSAKAEEQKMVKTLETLSSFDPLEKPQDSLPKELESTVLYTTPPLLKKSSEEPTPQEDAEVKESPIKEESGYLPPAMVEDFHVPTPPLTPKEVRLLQNPSLWALKPAKQGSSKVSVDAVLIKFSEGDDTVTAVVYQIPKEESLCLGTLKSSPDYTKPYNPKRLLLFDKTIEELKKSKITEADWALLAQATAEDCGLEAEDLSTYTHEILPMNLFLVTKSHPLPEILKRDGGIAEAQFLEDKSGRTLCEVKLSEVATP